MNPYQKSNLRLGLILFSLIILVLLVYKWSQDEGNQLPSTPPLTDTAIIDGYPELYRAVQSRNDSLLRPYLDHEEPAIRGQAWRALAHTPVENISPYIDRAVASGSEAAWFALSMHDMEEQQLARLRELWQTDSLMRGGISRVFGKQGNEQTLEFLLSRIDEMRNSRFEYPYALAIGRLLIDHQADDPEMISLVTRAMKSDSADVARAYLYGLYRGGSEQLSSAARDSIYTNWRYYDMGIQPEVDQYVARILGSRIFEDIVTYYNSEQLLESNVQVAIELAGLLSGVEVTADRILPAKILLTHTNPHVVRTTLQSLDGKLQEGGTLFRYIVEQMLPDPELAPSVWVRSLATVAAVTPDLLDSHRERLKRISGEHPYLLPEILGVYRIGESGEPFTARVDSIVSGGDPLRSLFAVRALGTWWQARGEMPGRSDFRDRIRSIVFDGLAMKDRGVAFALQNLLGDEALFGADDFTAINRALKAFSLPEDIEVFQAFGRLYFQQYRKQAAAVIDSLASLEYAPLNRALASVGWDVAVPEGSDTSFRTPGWERLWKLGREPVWVMETNKGMIKIKMDPLAAPATVSALDSLMRAGVYDGVPFHRVVPNFVIQGGDIERADGFGGPGFVLPTEGSEKEYTRGAAGIASAGPDTEGSQYFFMHQWKPHLNGNYTRFGVVVEGMTVVDRIVEGDSVRVVYWQ